MYKADLERGGWTFFEKTMKLSSGLLHHYKTGWLYYLRQT